MKKILLIILALVILLAGAAVSIPMIYKQEIISLINEEINKQVNAKVAIEDADVTIFSDFPDITAQLKGLKVTGVNEFKGDVLAEIKTFSATIDIMSVISGDQMQILSVHIQQPKILAKVLKNGKANWDIAKTDTSSAAMKAPSDETSSSFNINLKEYSIEDADIIYIDSPLLTAAYIKGLNHKGEGDFTEKLFTLNTKTTADEVTVEYEGVKYLNKIPMEINSNLEMDMEKEKYSFKENSFYIGQFKLKMDGSVAMLKDGAMDMNITFTSPGSSIKSLLTLVPAMYTSDYDNVKSDGELLFSGYYKGILSDHQEPGYGLDLTIKNGSIQYPDLPRSVNNIQTAIKVDVPEGNTDKMVLDVRSFHVEFGEDPFDMTLLFRPENAGQYFESSIKGNVNLGNIKDAIPASMITSLAGTMKMDLEARGIIEELQHENYDNFHAAGNLLLKDFVYADTAFPHPLNINEAALAFNPKDVELQKFAAKIGKSDVQMNGRLSNVFPYVLKENETLVADFEVTSGHFNANEWLTGEEETATDSEKTGTPETADEMSEAVKVPGLLNARLAVKVNELLYDNLILNDFRGIITVKDRIATLEGLQMKTLGGKILMDGYYATPENEAPKMDLSVVLANMSIKESFEKFNTMQQLAPIARYAQGNFSTNVSINSELDNEMMPKWESLNGLGLLNIPEASVTGFAPLDMMANKLDINELKNIVVKNIKPAFEIVGGKVFVKPFKVVQEDIKMNISGYNAIDQTMEYVINMDVPRSKLGSSANAAINDLLSSVDIDAGERIKFDVIMTGSVNDPEIKVDMAGAAQNMKDQLKAKAEAELAKQKAEAERKAKEAAEKVRKEAEREARKAKEKAKKEAEKKAKEEAEKAKKEAEEKAKDAIKGLFGDD